MLSATLVRCLADDQPCFDNCKDQIPWQARYCSGRELGISPLIYPTIIMVYQIMNQDNGVKGSPSNRWCSSPGRVFHAQQVDPDHQSAIVSKKAMLKITTWNAGTLFQKGKLGNVQQEMNRLGIDILGLSEIGWKDGGRINSESTTIIYSGGDSHLLGVGVILIKG